MSTHTLHEQIRARAMARRRDLQLRHSELKGLLQDVQVQLDDVTFMLGMIDARIAASTNREGAEPNSRGAGSRGRRSAWDNPDLNELLPLVREVIGAAGRPMARREILSALQARHNVEIRGKRPHVVLTTMLWRMRHDLLSIKGRGYWDPALGEPPEASVA